MMIATGVLATGFAIAQKQVSPAAAAKAKNEVKAKGEAGLQPDKTAKDKNEKKGKKKTATVVKSKTTTKAVAPTNK